MADYYHNPKTEKSTVLDEIWEHILAISKGKCNITDEMILNVRDEKYHFILGGLQILHEDLQAHKEDFVKKLEAEYKLEALKKESEELARKREAEHQIELLKKKNEELAQFNYVASHDLQEPLRTITSFSDILKRKYIEQLDAEAQMYLKFISESANRMSGLIFDLLNYSKIGREYKLEKIDCKQIVDAVSRDLDYAIAKTKPIIDVGDLPIINCNKTGMHQVFQNLIGNALKFRKPEETPKIEINVSDNGKQYLFCVADNGIGIEPMYKERIFGIFQRLHNKDKYDGTGIGLASCKKIIEMHQGKIWVESEFGIGSKFYFSIPKNK